MCGCLSHYLVLGRVTYTTLTADVVLPNNFIRKKRRYPIVLGAQIDACTPDGAEQPPIIS